MGGGVLCKPGPAGRVLAGMRLRGWGQQSELPGEVNEVLLRAVAARQCAETRLQV